MNVTDLMAAMAEGEIMAADFEQRFIEEFYRPLAVAQEVMAYLSLPPELQDEFQAAEPEAWERIKKVLSRGRRGG